jgi:hypothetical protein
MRSINNCKGFRGVSIILRVDREVSRVEMSRDRIQRDVRERVVRGRSPID